MKKHIDEVIWDLFQQDQRKCGFEETDKKIIITLKEKQRALARGGYTIGQLVYQAKLSDWMALTFDDIAGAPYRALSSRRKANLETELAPGMTMPMPLVASNMECVAGIEMAIMIARMGGVGVLHQFCTPTEQAQMAKTVKQYQDKSQISIDGRTYVPNLDLFGNLRVGAAIGVKDENMQRAKMLVEAGIDFLVVDIAHGHSDQLINTVKKLKDKYKIPIIAGNVVTPKGAYELCQAGADTLKVGVGPGAACTTRMVTGYGVPQITAIYETTIIAKEFNRRILADGGIRNSGAMVKALAAGADTIMLGRLMAATNKSNDFENRILSYDSETGVVASVEYYGSASARAKKKQKRGAFDAPEGRVVEIQYTGPTNVVLAQYITGLQSGLSYAGSSRDPSKDEHPNITRLRTKSRWIRQSVAGVDEGTKGEK